MGSRCAGSRTVLAAIDDLVEAVALILVRGGEGCILGREQGAVLQGLCMPGTASPLPRTHCQRTNPSAQPTVASFASRSTLMSTHAQCSPQKLELGPEVGIWKPPGSALGLETCERARTWDSAPNALASPSWSSSGSLCGTLGLSSEHTIQ